MIPRALATVIKENSNNNGIIIVGANKCRELRCYRKAGFSPIIGFEPIPEIYEKIKNNPGLVAYNYAVSNYIGESDFYVTNNSVSSSLLRPKKVIDLQQVKIEKIIKVQVTTLDTIITNPEQFAALIIDAEGSEMQILQGASELLKHVNIISTEVNYIENYEGCEYSSVVKNFIKNLGFKKINEKYCDRTKAYGDVAFARY